MLGSEITNSNYFRFTLKEIKEQKIAGKVRYFDVQFITFHHYLESTVKIVYNNSRRARDEFVLLDVKIIHFVRNTPDTLFQKTWLGNITIIKMAFLIAIKNTFTINISRCAYHVIMT